MLKKELINALNWRYATKHFDKNKEIDGETLDALKQTLVLSASSFGLQPYKFIIIQDQALREKLTAASWNQAQIVECSHLIVFVGKKNIDLSYIEDFINLTAITRQIEVSMLNDYKNMMAGSLINGEKNIAAWAAEQAYIALGNLLTSAALLKIDACPMEGIDIEKYNKILQIDEDHSALCVCALGFRQQDDRYQNLKKVRFTKEQLIKEI